MVAIAKITVYLVKGRTASAAPDRTDIVVQRRRVRIRQRYDGRKVDAIAPKRLSGLHGNGSRAGGYGIARKT